VDKIFAVLVVLVTIALAVLLASEEPEKKTPPPGPFNKHNILQYYGINVYKLRLDMAERICASGVPPQEALRKADEFVKALMAEDRKAVYERFP
jgi:hypothetical protein